MEVEARSVLWFNGGEMRESVVPATVANRRLW